jgi:hypothetical protein
MDYFKQTQKEIFNEKKKLHWGSHGTPIDKCYEAPLSVEPNLTDGVFSYIVVLHKRFGSKVAAKEWCQELVDKAEDVVCREIEDYHLPFHPRDLTEGRHW